MRYQVTKNLAGAHQVKFFCPGCKVKLTEALKNAGKGDACPDCGAQFTIPGEKERAAQQKQTHQQQAEADRRRAEKQAAKNKASQERQALRAEKQREKERQRLEAESEAIQPEPVYEPPEKTSAIRHSGIGLAVLSFMAFAVATINYLLEETTAENILQQIVFTLRFYGAVIAGCILLVGSCICFAVARSAKP